MCVCARRPVWGWAGGAARCYCALGAQRPPLEFGARRWQRGALAALPQVLLYLCPLLNRFLLSAAAALALRQFGCFVRCERVAERKSECVCDPSAQPPVSARAPRVPPVLEKRRKSRAGYTSPAARRPTPTQSQVRPALRSDPKRPPSEPTSLCWVRRTGVWGGGLLMFWLRPVCEPLTSPFVEPLAASLSHISDCGKEKERLVRPLCRWKSLEIGLKIKF